MDNWFPEGLVPLAADYGLSLNRGISPPVEALDGTPPYAELPPDRFERLCADIASSVEGTYLQLFGRPGQAQDGIDVYGRRSDGSYVAWQVKRRSTFRGRDLATALRVFVLGSKPFPVSRFVVAGSFDESERTLVYALEQARQANPDIEILLYGVRRITGELRQRPELVRQYLGETWVRHLCGHIPEATVEAPPARPAVGRGLARLPARGASQSPAWNIQNEPGPLIGRDELVEPPAAYRLAGRSTVTVITGLAGIGKTSIALHWAMALREAGDVDIGWRIRAEDPVVLHRDLIALSDVLGVPDPGDSERRSALLLEYLTATDQTWLLVFDNALDPTTVEPFLAKNERGTIYITTRHATRWHSVGTVIPLPELSKGDGIRLLCELSGTDNPEDAVGLYDALGGVPLALRQAALLSDRMQWSLDYCRTRLTIPPTALLKEASQGESESVLTILSSTIQQLTPLARHMLSLLSWLDPEQAPRQLVESARASAVLREPVERLERAMEELLSLSLVRADRHGHTIEMHRLVQLVARNAAISEAAVSSSQDHIAQLILAAWPSDPENPEQRPSADALLPHASRLANHLIESGAPTVALAQIVVATIDYLRVSGSSKDAFLLAERAADRLEAAVGLTTQHGRVHYLLGRLRARGSPDELGRDAVGRHHFSKAITLFGPDGEPGDLARAHARLAYVLFGLGQHEEGDYHSEEALRLASSLRPMDPRGLVSVLGIHVENLIRFGRYADAYGAAIEVNAVVDEISPPAHPLRSYAENQLAMACVRTNRWSDAVDHYRRAVEAAEAALGDRKTASLGVRYANLAWALLRMDQPAEALVYAEKSVDISEQIGSPVSAVALRRSYVADAHSLQGDPRADAEFMAVEAVLPTLTPATRAIRLKFIARHFTRNERHMEALCRLRAADELVRQGAKPRIEYATQLRRDLGAAEVRAGDPSRGETLLRDALAAFEATAGDHHRDTAATRVELARAIQQVNRLKALELAQRGFSDLEKCLGRNHRDTRAALELLFDLSG